MHTLSKRLVINLHVHVHVRGCRKGTELPLFQLFGDRNKQNKRQDNGFHRYGQHYLINSNAKSTINF